MVFEAEPPLMLQRDWTIWLAADHPEFSSIRDMLGKFAELLKSPDRLHMYRMTNLSLWNAASAGLGAEEICRFLHGNSRLGLPQTTRSEIRGMMEKYGQLRLEAEEEKLVLCSIKPGLLEELMAQPALSRFMIGRPSDGRAEIELSSRGRIKQELLRLGYPVEDAAGYLPGEALNVRLKSCLPNGSRFIIRDYQQEAVDAYIRQGRLDGGNGVVVLPCGAGKTVVGMAVMERFGCETLILTTNGTSVKQWIREILEKTELPEDAVGEYTGDKKEVRPVTVATYQILTHRNGRNEPFGHLELFNKRNWGLIIYDEVHLLPAPIFRATADIQGMRRLGLTATLVREDGCEADVFTLVGPKRYEVPWKQLEEEGWLAKVLCSEIRVPFAEEDRQRYAYAGAREKIRVAGENPAKLMVLDELLKRHHTDRVLIIGQYLDQLREVAERTGIPLISGSVPQEERDRRFCAFNEGSLTSLVVSKVANFAVDLPDANVAIQISGSFGSRQEEAQRLGRILRPKQGDNEAVFYTLVTEDSKEQDFAVNRQLFLLERGYQYEVGDPPLSKEEVRA